MKKALARLALTYLVIIMALSVGFSALFYQQSIREAEANLQRQQTQLKDYLYFTNPEQVQRIQTAQLELFRHNLLNKLMLLNVLMLVFGGALSFLLAKRSLRPLEEMLARQSRFTSDAAHELRTPLTAMKTELEVNLRAKNIPTKESKAIMKSSLEEIQKLDTLTSALLRLAKSTEKSDRSNYKHYKLSQILKSAYVRLDDKAQARKITVDIPKTNAVVYGDCDQLIELFVPLIGNAIKYSHENSKVEVSVNQKENKVLVSVKDSGVGIADVDLPRIFDRFYRADPSRNKTKAEGYGLGLSLAQAIAEAHGGKITVKSEYGKGSTFTVHLPQE